MLFYRFQPRRFETPNNKEMTFPETMEIIFHLGPKSAFGGERAYCPTVNAEGSVFVRYNPDSGRADFKSDQPLPLIKARITQPEEEISFTGNIIKYKGPCQNRRMLHDCICSIYYTFPIVMNIDLAEPPYVEKVEGTVGQIPFRWIYHDNNANIYPIDEKKVSSSFSELTEKTRNIDKKVTASLQYYHVACRLLYSGSTIWEFMSEAILNFHKALVVLFGNSMDSVRKGLEGMGYSKEDIEGDFIPLMILRNHFDVGHPQLAFPNNEQMRILYKYLTKAQFTFKFFYKNMFKLIKEGKYVTGYDDPPLSNEDQNKLNRLIDTMKKRI